MAAASDSGAREGLAILDIGLDRQLAARHMESESQARHAIYARGLPARIVDIVKAAAGDSSEPLRLADGLVEVQPVPVSHWSFFPPRAVAAASRLLSRRRFDVIQVQEPFLSGAAGLYLSRRYGLPLVAGAFSDQVDNPLWLAQRLLNRCANPVGRLVYRGAAAIRADSRAVAERLRVMGYRGPRFVPFLITHASSLLRPAPEAAPLRSRLLGRCAGPLLLTVSRLEPEKNLPLLLDAFRRARRSLPGLVLAVVGDGAERARLEASAGSWGPECLRWVGWIPNDLLAAYYRAADLFLLGSNYESSPRVLTEALLAGTPVLATDTAGSRESVAEGVSGRIVPVGDVGAFAEALVDLCSDRDGLARMGREGQAAAWSTAGTEAVLGGLRDLYASVLGHP